MKRETKRKIETPYEPFIYIVTRVKGSTIHARRLKDGKTVCRDASRIKPLKTGKSGKHNESVDNNQSKIVVPLSNEYYTKQKLSNIVNTEMIDQQESIQEAAQPRRSTRNRVSTFETQLRDYYSN